MLRKAGIVRQTFLFVALLIVLVTLVSFGILYYAMPSYYLYKKQSSLTTGTKQLEVDLKSAADQDACAALIADFSEQYNVVVLAFDENEVPIIQLSTPFVSMNARDYANGHVMVQYDRIKEADGETYSIFITQSNENEQLKVRFGARVLVEEPPGDFAIYDSGGSIYVISRIGSDFVDTIRLQGTLQPIDEARDVIFSLIPYVLAAGSIIGLLLAWIYARQISKPILRLSAAAVKMKEMEPDALSKLQRNDELGLLSENLDSLYQSLSKTIASLKAEMEKVNRLEHSKTEMMQSASHELKTPVAALNGMLEGMIDGVGVYQDRNKYLLKCQEQVHRLSILVKEILDASRADTKAVPERFLDTAVDEMVRHILSEHDFQITRKCLQLDISLSRVIIRTEPAMLCRAITNLVGNAVAYTPANARIRLSLREWGMEIENQCPHIPKDEVQKLFEPFYTRSDSRDRSVSGTGLGLYLVRRNLEKLSIAFQVESTSDGFRFCMFWQNE